MQYSFKSFVQALQTAIVESSETINKRNMQIIEDYFVVDTDEVMLENAAYNRDLFDLVSSLKNNAIFSDSLFREVVFRFIPENEVPKKPTEFDTEEYTFNATKIQINDDDSLLFQIFTVLEHRGPILEKFVGEISKLTEEISSLEKVPSSSPESSGPEDADEATLDNLKQKRVNKESEKTTLASRLLDVETWIEKVEFWIKNKLAINSISIETEVNNLNEFLNLRENLKNPQNYLFTLRRPKTNFKKELKVVEQELEELNRDIDKLQNVINNKEELSSLEVSNSEIKSSKILEDSRNKLNLFGSYKNSFEDASRIYEECLAVFKTTKAASGDFLERSQIIETIISVKRYKLKQIQSYIPRTVRVNYPATFDYVTPDNDKEYKVISTPIEVPLITLVPITSCNIEKAVLKANFKFDIDKDDVKIDFTNDKISSEQAVSNFGSLEIVLSPSQTPEGLKALIESYENFLKRQIV